MSHCATVHYSAKNGNDQRQLQLLAADIVKYGKLLAQARHVTQEFNPNGDQRIIETGASCIEILNELTGSRFWVHFSGCRVTEIIEEYRTD